MIDSEGLLIPSARIVEAVNTTEADLVQDLYRRIVVGGSALGEAQRLNALGVRTTRFYQNSKPCEETQWHPGPMASLIANLTYKGVHILKSKHGEMERRVPPLVDEGLWQAANKQLQQNRRLPKSNATRTYLLRGFITCGRCGSHYVGQVVNRAHSALRIYYRCGGGRLPDYANRKVRCSGKTIDAEWIEGIVWEADPEMLRFTFVSKQAERILGYPVEQWLDEPRFWREHIHPEDRASAMDLSIAATAQKRDYDSEYRMLAADNRVVSLRDLVSVVIENGYPARLRGVMLDITLRKRAEQELEELAGRLIHAQEQERSRIGRELHDHISQMLGVLTIRIDQLRVDAAVPAGVGAALDELRQSAAQITDDIHGLSHRLHSSALDYLGLVPALQKLVNEFSARHTIAIQFEHDSVPAPLPSDVALCLFRVTEESLTNIAKHSQATSARVQVTGSPEGIQLTIEDSGRGFDLDSLGGKAGLGFVSMRERLRALRGTVRVDSAPERGARITVWVPETSIVSPSHASPA